MAELTPGGNLLPTIEPSPTFATDVMARIAEVERLRQIERAEARRAPRLLAACLAWALLLGWTVTGLLVPPWAALCYTLARLSGLLPEVAPYLSLGLSVALSVALAALLLRLRGAGGPLPQPQS